HDHQRACVRGEHARVQGEGRRPRPVGRARARRGPPHLPRPRPPVAGARRLRPRHAHPRPGRELPHPLARGGPGHVALPLPRRGAHDARDDRPLPGVEVRVALVSGLAALVLAAAAPAAGPGGSAVREVTMPGKVHAPGRIQVLVGDTVVWRNADATNHTVTSDDDVFDSGYVAPGLTFSRAFEKTGAYRYHCTIHRFMRGEVVVVPVALSAPTGSVV